MKIDQFPEDIRSYLIPEPTGKMVYNFAEVDLSLTILAAVDEFTVKKKARRHGGTKARREEEGTEAWRGGTRRTHGRLSRSGTGT